MLKRKVSADKRSSTMKLRSKQSNLSQGNGLGFSHGDDLQPKTRFSLNDRSCSSPRLKNFPAEQIKRTDSPPTKNPNGNESEMSHQLQNTGQGDTLVQQSSFKSHPFPQSFTLPNQNTSIMSEQQVPHAICPVNQQVNHSELIIPSPMGNASHERPPHRPHVPPANTTLHDLSPKIPFSPQPTRLPQNIHQTQVLGSSEQGPNQYQSSDPRTIKNDLVKPPAPENESVRDSDRYPGFFRRPIPANRYENINSCPIPQRLMAAPNVPNVCPVAGLKPVDMAQHQQISHGQQANMQHYQNNNFQSGMVRRQLVESYPRMKSSQDVALNQNQNWQKPVQLNSQSQNSWVQNNGPQLQSYATNALTPGTFNPVNTQCYRSMEDNEIQGGPNQHNTLQGYSHVQQPSYAQKNLPTSQIRSPPEINSKTSSGDDRQAKGGDKMKVLKFTPNMIKDQEMLVTTMRQQRIPEEIMRRQFDALLTEQRKQLLYLEQLERNKMESNESKPANQGRRVQRKISKIEEDGKPEWMLHITPPRIPYHVIEKMRSEREVNFQQGGISGNSEQASPADAQQHLHGPIVQDNRNQTWQHNGPNAWQQSSQYQTIPMAHDCSIANVSRPQQTFNMTGYNSGQPQMSHYGFPMQYQQQYMQQVPQQMGQGGFHHAREDIQQDQRHQQPDKSLEPSSLLKLRLYKEVIRKQKQNNGLQDPETVREAIEALKNPANRKGLDYLDSLSKTPGKSAFNDAQFTQQQSFLMTGSPPEQNLRQPTKMPSANGLENQRNPYSSTTSSLLHQKQLKESQWPEYPRQKVKSASRDCHNFIAEKENGTVARSLPTDYQKSYPAMTQDSMMHHSMTSHPMYTESKLEAGGQIPGHLQQGFLYSYGQALADGSSSMPYTFVQQNQQQYHAGQMNQFQGNPNSYCQPNGPHRQSYVIPQPVCPSGGLVFKGNGDIHQQFSNKNTEIQEIIMPGGLKYLARKPEYILNSSAPLYQQNVHSGKYFNAPIPCQ